MNGIFEKNFEAGWTDMDPNGHMANTAYLGYAVNTRISFFAANGFAPADFVRHRIGPVIKSDLTEYFREILMLDQVRVTMENGGSSDDCSRFRIVNNFYKSDGTHAARVTSIGGWLSLSERKLIAPPEELGQAWFGLSKTKDFEELSSSIKS